MNGMHASAPWYTSGAFWAGASVVAVVLVGAATVLVTWLVGVPKRALLYSVPVETSLLPRYGRFAKNAFSDLEITHGGKKLDDPHIISLRLESASRRDIRSDDFDQGRPLVFHVGAPVVTLLGAGIPLNFPPEGFRIRGDRAEIGPVLIRKKDLLTIDLLTDGRPDLVCESPLIDVSVKERSLGEVGRSMLERFASALALAALARF
jgi:hypothetical protein